MTAIKEQLYRKCQEFVNRKIDAAQGGIDELQESANMETKSSVGDKYETNRAMIHIEREKYSAQLLESQKMQKVISQINPEKTDQKVELGSLVLTNVGNYYVCIAAGKVKLEGKDYFIISQASPIGQQLKGKKKGDTFNFNKRDFEVLDVL